jgi:hypothetical protein
LEALVTEGPGGRVVAAGALDQAEKWAAEIGLDLLQWTDHHDYRAAHVRATQLIEVPYLRFQPIDGKRETLDVFWIGPARETLDREDPVVKKILGPLFA